MSDREFGRPGAPVRPPPEHWPYHTPTPAEPVADVLPDITPEPHEEPDGPPRRGVRLLVAVVIGVVAGAILGGVWVSGVLRDPAVPPPIPITLDTFPSDLLGAQRNDVALRKAGFNPTVERLDAEFEAQLAAFRFSYGGDGATLGYGRLLTLTIVNGVLPSNLPRDGSVGGTGQPAQSRRLISLSTATISCTFEPATVQDPETGLAILGDFNSEGRTDCVLVDVARDLSLRIAHAQVARGADAFATAAAFRDELERIHTAIVA